MTCSRPFYRNFREMVKGPNSGYSSWAYIVDPDYARDASHYVRACELIQADLRGIFEFIEPSDECLPTFSYRIHALLMRSCIEVEANFKAILAENKFTPPSNGFLNISHYRKVDASHHLSSYEVMLPIWRGKPKILKPFKEWRPDRGKQQNGRINLPWYQAYNNSKHNRHQAFKQANFENLLNSVAGLLVLITSQFKDKDFSAAPGRLLLETGGSDSYESSTGSLFRIKYPDDWSEDESYAFDWSELKGRDDRFSKFDYDAIPL